MAPTLYVVHGSHPCAAVEKAFELKGLPVRRVELPPPLHAPVQKLRFGTRTVPALRLEDGEKVSGSRAILRRLEELVPQPPLFPAGGEARTRVKIAEEWGDEVYQPIARRLCWAILHRHPRSLASYQRGSSLPALPRPVLRALAPALTRVERRLNGADDGAVRADLIHLPRHLDRVDGWLADGVLGGCAPNAADLQIAATTRLLLTFGDLQAMLAGRPAREHALRLFGRGPGSTPPGVLPPAWVSAGKAAWSG